ncbi:MAG: hypothetical protein M3332_02260 [Actinomycetota bacterium]|nr:hypothetical protein [Actinomycetota bacterium]
MRLITNYLQLMILFALALIASGCGDSMPHHSQAASLTSAATGEANGTTIWRNAEERYIPAVAPLLTVGDSELKPFYQIWPNFETLPPKHLRWEMLTGAADTVIATVEEPSVPIRVVALAYADVDASGIPLLEEADEQRCHELRSLSSSAHTSATICSFAPSAQGTTTIILPLESCAAYRIVQVSWAEASATPHVGRNIPEASASYGWRTGDRCAALAASDD